MNTHVDITVRVRYAETDQMGIAYYAHHFVWFELGRTEWFRQQGFVYKEMEEQEGAYIIVAEARCRYHAPARYDDLLVIRTRIQEARSRSITFSYEILSQPDEQLLAIPNACLGGLSGPRSLPDRYRALFAATTQP